MKYTEFKSSLGSGKEFPVYLFEGEDAFFRERGLALLKNEYLSEPELNLVVLNPDCTVDGLVTSLNGYPFMSRKRITVIREFYPKQDFFKNGFKDYLENPSDCSLLVILNEKPSESLKKFDSVCVVDCSKADVSLLVKWIKAECNKNLVDIQAETAKMLADYCSLDMTRVENETTKLCFYVGENATITSQDVEQMVSRDQEHKIYEMTDFIANKRFDKALAVINDMLGKGESSQMIIVSVYNYFRKLLHASISGLELKELSSALGMGEYPTKKVMQQASKFKKRALKSAVDALTDADFRVKSGKNETDAMMWLTVFKIMTD
ncbi:MAG: DNA polymerase III subunit delta [Clostridia bacterium]|nr:DNA polymerase III subunit delta [Clostridia bacterium]